MVDLSHQKYRRILLQMDAATHCRETMGTAIDIAARLGVELQGIFIEDNDLISIGKLDFIREFRLSSPIAHNLDKATLDAQLRAMANSVRRQLERAGSRKKVTVRFHAVRGDVWIEQERLISETDLIVAESTGRLHSRLYRAQLSRRSSSQKLLWPTLLLKGGKSLTKQFTVICDSVEAARKGLRAALALSETGEKKITLLPFALTAGDVDELSHIVSQGEKGIQVAPTMVQSASSVLQIMDPAESVIVITEGGTFLREKSNAEQLFESRHPLLLVQ